MSQAPHASPFDAIRREDEHGKDTRYNIVQPYSLRTRLDEVNNE